MKRFFALLLACLMLLAFASCAAKEPTTPDPKENDQQTDKPSEQPDDTKPDEQSEEKPDDKPDDAKKDAIFTGEDKVIDIYLVAGQSNAVGYTGIVDEKAAYAWAPELKKGFSNVLFAGKLRWDAGSDYASKNYEWRKTVLGLGVGDGNKMGPEAGMAKAFAEVYNKESGKVAGILKYGHGGTSLIRDPSSGGSNQYGTWTSPTYALKEKGFVNEAEYKASKTGALYREFLQVTKARLESLASKGYTNVNIKGLYWMQGENDRFFPDEYKKAFSAFASDIRRDIAEIVRELTGGDDRGAADMPILVGLISETQNLDAADREEINKTFIEMQKTLPNLVDNCYIVDNSQYKISRYDESTGKANATGLGWDQWHWCQADHLEIGYNVGETFLDIGKLK